jgi:hypothetical protein
MDEALLFSCGSTLFFCGDDECCDGYVSRCLRKRERERERERVSESDTDLAKVMFMFYVCVGGGARC